MTGAVYRDISADRRARAAACVERHLEELAEILDAAQLPHRIVEGSAVAAEVYLSETNTLHTAVRVALDVDQTRLAALDRALVPSGFEKTEPSGDSMLMRMASRNGRRAIHVLFEGDGAPADSAGLHPGDPEALRERVRHLGAAWRDLSVAYRRVRHAAAPEHDVTESFEVQVIAPRPRTPPTT